MVSVCKLEKSIESSLTNLKNKRIESYLRSSWHWHFVTIWGHLWRCGSHVLENWCLICWRWAVASWILRSSGVRIRWWRSDNEMLLWWHLGMAWIWWRSSSIIHRLHLWHTSTYRILKKRLTRKIGNILVKSKASSCSTALFWIDIGSIKSIRYLIEMCLCGVWMMWLLLHRHMIHHVVSCLLLMIWVNWN